MNEDIRRRLLNMTHDYHTEIEDAIRAHREMTVNREVLEARRVKILDGMQWGPNEQTRKAQTEAALLEDPQYQSHLVHGRNLDEEWKAGQMRLEALRFERDILCAIVAADGYDALAAASAGAVYGTLERLLPGTSDPRD